MSTICLGADINSSMPSKGIPKDIDVLLSVMQTQPSILMVGTLEPRKGHEQTLVAIEQLWHQGRNVNLIVVGKPGWKTETLQQKLRAISQNKSHLYWFESASDELLDLLYAKCTGIIVASHAEGFGLPVIEAMRYGKPILLRDIPVFREVGGEIASYFSGTSSDVLASDIVDWLNKIDNGQLKYHSPQQTWQNSAHELLISIGLANTRTQPATSKSTYALGRHEVVA